MKLSRCFYFVCFALAGLVLSEPTAAITLGRLRGASVLGHPLALTIPLQTTDDEDVSGLCVAADIYFGESQIEASNVTARLEVGAGSALVRIAVRKPVDEPVVTVYLKTGCQQQSMRKYVLLSEFSSEVQAPTIATLTDVVPAKGSARVSSPSMTAVAPFSQQPPAQSQAKPPSKTKSGAVPAFSKAVAGTEFLERSEKSVAAPSQSKTKLAKKKSAASGGARLKLLPLELTQDWEPTLRMTDELVTPSVEIDVQKRVQAAELWHIINAAPEDILQEAGKRTALEAELNSLVASSRANQVAIADLNVQLQAAQEGRLWNPVVYALIALLAVCSAGFVYAIHRNRERLSGRNPWWLGAKAGGDSGTFTPSGLRDGDGWSERPSSGSQQADNSAKSGNVTFTQTDIDIPLSDSAVPVDAPVGLPRENPVSFGRQHGGDSKPMDFMHSNAGALRAINTHEMVDVRQQADFFLALGQHDEAIGVLYGALSQSTESNPHIYLDLIALLHKLSRKDEYEKVRHAFNALYTCHVPAYGEYSSSGRGLIEYPELLMPLVKLWPTPVAIEYVEKCLVREESDSSDCSIDMDAFKDLLLLHGILGSVVVPHASHAIVVCPSRRLPVRNSAQSFLGTRGFSSTQRTDIDFDLSDGS